MVGAGEAAENGAAPGGEVVVGLLRCEVVQVLGGKRADGFGLPGDSSGLAGG